jgi:DNA mismatch repair protein MutS2
MNIKALQQLEFYTIKEKLSNYAISDEGRELIEALTPSDNINRIKQTLLETTEARQIINKTSAVPIQN